MKAYLRTPKAQLAVTLIVILLAALLLNFSFSKLVLAVTVLITTILFDLVFIKVRKKNLFIPEAAIVTSLIITLLSDPGWPLYIPIAAAAIAMASKNFIRPGRHIFNPAALGLAIASILFQVSVAWWGPASLFPSDLSKLPFFLLLFSSALVSILRMKRHFTIISFLLSYIVLTLISVGTFSPDSLYRIIVDPTVIFFALVMAPEPMTTPASRNNQLLFGLSLGILTTIFSRTIFQIPLVSTLDPLVLSLLLGNLIFFKRR